MKNKKVSILLAMALAFTTLLTASGSGGGASESAAKPAGEVLRASIEKQFEVESAHSNMNAVLNVDFPEEAKQDPSVAMVEPFLKEAKLNVEQTAHMKEGLAYSTIEAEAGGQKINGEMAMVSPTKMVLKSDLMPEVIVLDMEEMMAMAQQMGGGTTPKMPTSFNAMFTEEFKPVVTAYLDILDEAFKGNEPTERTEEEIEFASGKESLDMITYSYKSNDEVLALVEKVANNIFTSEKMYDLVFKNEALLELMGEGAKENIPAKKDYDEMMKQVKEAFDKEFPKAKEEMAKAIEIKDLTFKAGIDKDGYMRYTKMIFDGVIKQGEMDLPIKLELVSDVDSINAVKKEDVKTIEYKEDEAVSFEELMMLMMMGGMDVDVIEDDMSDDEDMDMEDLEADLDEISDDLDEISDDLELTDEEKEALENLDIDVEDLEDQE